MLFGNEQPDKQLVIAAHPSSERGAVTLVPDLSTQLATEPWRLPLALLPSHLVVDFAQESVVTAGCPAWVLSDGFCLEEDADGPPKAEGPLGTCAQPCGGPGQSMLSLEAGCKRTDSVRAAAILCQTRRRSGSPLASALGPAGIYFALCFVRSAEGPGERTCQEEMGRGKRNWLRNYSCNQG